MSRQRIGLLVAAAFYSIAGVFHFIKTDAYLKAVPPYIPWHLAMVRISGAAEIAGGLGLLIKSLRKPAAWGLIALLIAVFPANIYMATNPIESGAESIPTFLLWARLLVQPLLIWWLVWCIRPTVTRPYR